MCVTSRQRAVLLMCNTCPSLDF
uniref:Uncharacterized protein n=1 Tax=Anguilla anguilla TaxID=7936 RepID=A0A0E9VI58_ANGAN